MIISILKAYNNPTNLVGLSPLQPLRSSFWFLAPCTLCLVRCTLYQKFSSIHLHIKRTFCILFCFTSLTGNAQLMWSTFLKLFSSEQKKLTRRMRWRFRRRRKKDGKVYNGRSKSSKYVCFPPQKFFFFLMLCSFAKF